MKNLGIFLLMIKYLRFVKFSHTVFALPFALIGFTLGAMYNDYHADKAIFIYVLLCMITARTAAMAFNRLIDSKYDAANPRTALREIPRGIISVQAALVLVLLSSLLFCFFSYCINSLCFVLSPIALIVILGYSYLKRFTSLCHLVLGLGLSFAPIGAYIACTSRFDVLPILFSLVVLTWVCGFDIIYALQDEEFDRYHGLKSIPVALGKKNALFLARIIHGICAIILIYIWQYMQWHYFFTIGMILFLLALFIQQSLVRHDDLSRVNMAFFTTNGIASIVFGVFTIGAIIWKHIF